MREGLGHGVLAPRKVATEDAAGVGGRERAYDSAAGLESCFVGSSFSYDSFH
jgi:hypothetical protein